MVKKNILLNTKPKKLLKPIINNGTPNAELQFNVKRDLNIAKKVKPTTVFENYKVNVKKSKT